MPLPDWIIIKSVIDQVKLKELEQILDAGEASAISLALESENPTLIIDEKKGRKVATDLKIQIIGTLKVLLIAKQKGIIPSVKNLVDLLTAHSFRFSNVIVDEILHLANEA